MNYQMSSCREPATITFSPFQDPPHPPIGNILEKVNNTKLKGEPTIGPSFQSNIIQIGHGSLIVVHESKSHNK